jgi:cytochrome c556
MRRSSYLLCLPLLLASLLPLGAHDHATGVIKERMEMMQQLGKHLKSIRERIDAKRDLGSIKADAEAIATHAPHVAHLFPKGSTQKPTEARAAIWQNWADFERKAAALEAVSKKLVNADPNDFDAISAEARGVTQACIACHEKYRSKSRKEAR